MNELMQRIDRIEPEIRAVWQQIHRHPELGLAVRATAERIEAELRAHTEHARIHRVGEAGLWVELDGTAPGDRDNVLMLRGDMDALPIQEAVDVPYRSCVPNVMHACGHDVHASSLLGAVRVLESYRDRFAGSIWFFFQPGEEILAGARTFLADPAIDFRRVRAAAGCHVLGFTEVGKVSVRYGKHLAGCDSLRFTVHGRTAHASTPNYTVDAIVAAASLIEQLQHLISREIDPTDSVVLTLGRIEGGTQANMVADKVVIEGGLRTIDRETRRRVLDRVGAVCDGLGTATGSRIEFVCETGAPVLINDRHMADIAVRAVSKALGPDAVEIADRYALAAEDFAFYVQDIPGLFMSIGCRTPGREPVPAHTPQFYTDPGAVRAAMAAYCSFALEYFGADY